MPDAALIGGWSNYLERRAGRRLRKLGRPVVCAIDNPWLGRPRQWLGILAAPLMLRPMANVAWVAGESQARFARYLGFSVVGQGLYCADIDAYGCRTLPQDREQALLFTGRLVFNKGIDLLVDAYARYRREVANPLELWVAGTGPLASLLDDQPGIRKLGFVQPALLPGLMSKVQALVLPSRLEHWGVVIHEAVSAGLPVLVSRNCMAAEAFVRDGANGYLYESSADALLRSLLAFHRLAPTQRQAMSRQSRELALTWTPDQQIDRFESLVAALPAPS